MNRTDGFMMSITTIIKRLCVAGLILVAVFGLVGCPNLFGSEDDDQSTQDTTPPSEVTELTATGGEGQVVLAWTNPTDEDFDSVTIHYGTASADTEFTGTIDPSGTTIAGLTNGTEYTFLVRSFDTDGNESAGVSTTATPVDTNAPSDVSDLSIEADYRSVTLSWTDPTESDFDHVEISYGSEDSADTDFTGTVSSSGTTIDGLTPKVEYTFAVRAVDTAGNTSSGVTDHIKPWGKIVFLSDRDNSNMEIYTMLPDGSDVQRLTINTFVETDPSWSPDNSQIAFAATDDGDYDIYVMDADGSNRTRVYDTDPPVDSDEDQDEFDIEWSPDGSKIIFANSDDQICTVKPDGTGFQVIVDPGTGDKSANAASYSTDGSQIMFLSDQDGTKKVYVADSDGTNQEIRYTPIFSDGVFPHWRGPSILVTDDIDEDSDFSNNVYDFELVAIDPETGESTVLVSDGDDGTATESEITGFGRWSPSTDKLLFAKYFPETNQFDIFMADADGSNEVNLTNTGDS
ncbi:MAG: DUF4959 domain-containing protein, partial [Alkalispirochaeta sp.]